MELEALVNLIAPVVVATVTLLVFIIVDFRVPKIRLWLTIAITIVNLYVAIQIRIESM